MIKKEQPFFLYLYKGNSKMDYLREKNQFKRKVFYTPLYIMPGAQASFNTSRSIPGNFSTFNNDFGNYGLGGGLPGF